MDTTPRKWSRFTVLFDLDDTLLDERRATTTAASAFFHEFRSDLPTGSESDFLDGWNRSIKAVFSRYTSGALSFTEQRRWRMREVFGQELSDGDADARFAVYLHRYESHWSLFPDSLPFLTSLAGSYPLGIITNGNQHQQRNKLERLDILPLFTTVVISEEVGSAKPSQEIFLHACRCGRVPPENTYYVGDRLDRDAEASARAGLRGVWLSRDASPGP